MAHEVPEEACSPGTSETVPTSESRDHDILVVRSIHKLNAALKHCASKFHQDPHKAKQSSSNGSFKLVPKSILKLFRWIVAAVKRLGSNFKNACYRQTSISGLTDNSEPGSPIVDQVVTSEVQHSSKNLATEEEPATSSSSSANPENSSDVVVKQSMPTTLTDTNNHLHAIDELIYPLVLHSSVEPATSSSTAPLEDSSNAVVKQSIPTTSVDTDGPLYEIDEPTCPSVMYSSDEASPKVETQKSPEVELPFEVQQVAPFSSDRFTFEATISLDIKASPMSSLSVEAEQPATSSAPSSIEASPKVETHQSPKVELPVEIEHTALTPLRPSSNESSPVSEPEGSPNMESPSEARWSRRRVLTPRSLAGKIPDDTLKTLLASKHQSDASDTASTSSDSPGTSSQNTTLATVSPVSSILSSQPKSETGPMGQAFSSIEREMWTLKEEIRACKGKEEYGKVNHRDSTQFNLFDKLESPDSRRARIAQGVMAYKKRLELEDRLEEMEETMKNLVKTQLRASEGTLKEKIEARTTVEMEKKPLVVEKELMGRAETRTDARKKKKKASRKAKSKAKRDENAKKVGLLAK